MVGFLGSKAARPSPPPVPQPEALHLVTPRETARCPPAALSAVPARTIRLISPLFKAALLRYNLHVIQLAHLKYTTRWVLTYK